MGEILSPLKPRIMIMLRNEREREREGRGKWQL